MWSNDAQVGSTWSAADHLWTRDSHIAIPFSEQALFWLDEIFLTSGSTENSVGTLDSKEGPWKHID